MTIQKRVYTIAVVLAVFAATVVSGQTPGQADSLIKKQPAEQPVEQTTAPEVEERGKFSMGISLGMFQPLGEWKDHRFAPGVDQFSRGFMFTGILEFKLARWIALGFTFGRESLGVGEWVDYAQSQGDEISATAFMWHLGLVFRPFVLNRPRDVIKLDFGFSQFFPQGEESFEHLTYDYNFLVDRIGFILGVEYNHFFMPKLALALRIGWVLIDSAVDYADGVTYTLTGMPMTIGIRYHP